MSNAKDRSGVLSVLLTLPPALTVVAAISTWLTFGAVGEWLQTYWFPITRALWVWVLTFANWAPPPDMIDMLTAIVFFLPAALLPRKSDDRNFRLRSVALILSLATAWILARHSLSDGWTFLNMGFAAFGQTLFLFLYPFALFTLISVPLNSIFDSARVFASGGTRNTTHAFQPNLPVRRRLLHAVVTLVISVLCLGYLSFEAYQFWTLGLGFNLAAGGMELITAPHPIRTTLAAILAYLALEQFQGLAGSGHSQTELNPTPDVAGAEDKADAPQEGRDWYWITYGAVILAGFVWGAWRFGPVNALIVTTLFGLVIATSLRAPQRMIQIAGTVLILITGAYVIDILAWLQRSLEALA